MKQASETNFDSDSQLRFSLRDHHPHIHWTIDVDDKQKGICKCRKRRDENIVSKETCKVQDFVENSNIFLKV